MAESNEKKRCEHNQQVMTSRKKVKELKRVNDLICEYVKVKDRKLYDEGMELYNKLNIQYPKKNNLTKTHEFKNVIRNITIESGSEAPEAQRKETQQVPEAQCEESQQVPEVQREESQQAESGGEQHNILSLAVQDYVEGNNISVEDIEDNVDRIVDEIIRDLETAQPEIFNDFNDFNDINDEDEGVDLNPLDEIEMDMEDFNYEIEVEPYNW